MMMRILLLILSLLPAAAVGQTSTVDFSGLRLSLVHETKIETYRLGKNGSVLAQHGTQHGPIAGPAYRWRIDAAGRLEIADDKGVKERFEILEKTENTLKVRRQNGETAVFQISRME